MENEEKGLMKESFSQLKECGVRFWPPFLSFFIMLAAFLILGVYQPWTYLITAPFLILPLLFAFQTSLSTLKIKGKTISWGEFFRSFAAYFSHPFYGSYRVIRSALFALLFSIFFGYVYQNFFVLIASAYWPLFQEGISELQEAIQHIDPNEIINIVNNNQALSLFYGTANIVRIGIFFFVFLHLLFRNMLLPHLKNSVRQLNNRGQNQIYQMTIRLLGNKYRGAYYKHAWPLYPLMIGGFALGSYLGTLFLSNYFAVAGFGIAFSLLFILFYLPYHLELMDVLFAHFSNNFKSMADRLALQTLEQLKMMQRISEEQAEQLKRRIDESKRENPNDMETPSTDDYGRGDTKVDNEKVEQKETDSPKSSSAPDLSDYGTRDGNKDDN